VACISLIKRYNLGSFFQLTKEFPWLLFVLPVAAPRSVLSTTWLLPIPVTVAMAVLSSASASTIRLPAGNAEGLRVSLDRLTYWQENGAQLSPTVARLVKQHAAKQAA
jgi:hypothetical protein